MAADFQPIPVGADVIGIVDHPGRQPEQLPLQLLQNAEPAFARAPDGAEAILRDLPAPANDSVPLRRGHLLVHRGGRV